jgi:uncharacterized protein (TIGR02588 family)
MPERAPRKDKVKNEDDTPLLEWIFGGIGFVLFAAALTVSVVNGLGKREPPSITTRIEPAEQIGGRFRVEFEAVNAGDQTASLVELVAILREGGSVVETHTVEIDFLPPHSSRRAGVFLDQDPHGRTLEIVAVAYQHP